MVAGPGTVSQATRPASRAACAMKRLTSHGQSPSVWARGRPCVHASLAFRQLPFTQAAASKAAPPAIVVTHWQQVTAHAPDALQELSDVLGLSRSNHERQPPSSPAVTVTSALTCDGGQHAPAKTRTASMSPRCTPTGLRASESPCKRVSPAAVAPRQRVDGPCICQDPRSGQPGGGRRATPREPSALGGACGA